MIYPILIIFSSILLRVSLYYKIVSFYLLFFSFLNLCFILYFESWILDEKNNLNFIRLFSFFHFSDKASEKIFSYVYNFCFLWFIFQIIFKKIWSFHLQFFLCKLPTQIVKKKIRRAWIVFNFFILWKFLFKFFICVMAADLDLGPTSIPCTVRTIFFIINFKGLG